MSNRFADGAMAAGLEPERCNPEDFKSFRDLVPCL
jgi:hypothetical protein